MGVMNDHTRLRMELIACNGLSKLTFESRMGKRYIRKMHCNKQCAYNVFYGIYLRHNGNAEMTFYTEKRVKL